LTNNDWGITEAQIDLAIDQLRAGKSRPSAMRSIGFDSAALDDLMARSPELTRRVLAAEAEANGRVEDALFDSAEAGNVTAQQLWLLHRSPERWRPKPSLAAPVTPQAAAQSGEAIKLSETDNKLMRLLLDTKIDGF